MDTRDGIKTSIDKLFGSEGNHIDLGPKGQRWGGRKLSKQTEAGPCCETQGWVGFASHAQGCWGGDGCPCPLSQSLCCHIAWHHQQLFIPMLNAWTYPCRQRGGFRTGGAGSSSQCAEQNRGADPQILTQLQEKKSVFIQQGFNKENCQLLLN